MCDFQSPNMRLNIQYKTFSVNTPPTCDHIIHQILDHHRRCNMRNGEDIPKQTIMALFSDCFVGRIHLKPIECRWTGPGCILWGHCVKVLLYWVLGKRVTSLLSIYYYLTWKYTMWQFESKPIVGLKTQHVAKLIHQMSGHHIEIWCRLKLSHFSCETFNCS